jgi:hypothetical protein
MNETIRGRAIEGLLLMFGLIVGGWIPGQPDQSDTAG